MRPEDKPAPLVLLRHTCHLESNVTTRVSSETRDTIDAAVPNVAAVVLAYSANASGVNVTETPFDRVRVEPAESFFCRVRRKRDCAGSVALFAFYDPVPIGGSHFSVSIHEDSNNHGMHTVSAQAFAGAFFSSSCHIQNKTKNNHAH